MSPEKYAQETAAVKKLFAECWEFMRRFWLGYVLLIPVAVVASVFDSVDTERRFTGYLLNAGAYGMWALYFAGLLTLFGPALALGVWAHLRVWKALSPEEPAAITEAPQPAWTKLLSYPAGFAVFCAVVALYVWLIQGAFTDIPGIGWRIERIQISGDDY